MGERQRNSADESREPMNRQEIHAAIVNQQGGPVAYY
jgi:hypothetical protein